MVDVVKRYSNNRGETSSSEMVNLLYHNRTDLSSLPLRTFQEEIEMSEKITNIANRLYLLMLATKADEAEASMFTDPLDELTAALFNLAEKAEDTDDE